MDAEQELEELRERLRQLVLLAEIELADDSEQQDWLAVKAIAGGEKTLEECGWA